MSFEKLERQLNLLLDSYASKRFFVISIYNITIFPIISLRRTVFTVQPDRNFCLYSKVREIKMEHDPKIFVLWLKEGIPYKVLCI